MTAKTEPFSVTDWLRQAEDHLPPGVLAAVRVAVSGYVAGEVEKMQRLLADLQGNESSGDRETSGARSSTPVSEMSAPELVFYVLGKNPNGLGGGQIVEMAMKLNPKVEEANIRSAIYRESTKVNGQLSRSGQKGEFIYFLKSGRKYGAKND